MFKRKSLFYVYIVKVKIKYFFHIAQEINETPWQALFFDMGAGTTKAALVEYKNVKVKDRGYVETVPQLQVLGVAYDR